MGALLCDLYPLTMLAVTREAALRQPKGAGLCGARAAAHGRSPLKALSG